MGVHADGGPASGGGAVSGRLGQALAAALLAGAGHVDHGNRVASAGAAGLAGMACRMTGLGAAGLACQVRRLAKAAAVSATAA